MTDIIQPKGAVMPMKPEILVRARRDEDVAGLVQIRNMPRVRWGTLSLPFESISRLQQRFAEEPPDATNLVACIGDAVVGEAGIHQKPMARIAHGASLGINVHDDWQNCGVGSALFTALMDVADNWLGLRRLELTVYTDNAPAIALYKKFGFEIETTEIADAFRDGAFVDAHRMARLRGHLPPDISSYPALPPPAPAAPYLLRASEPGDLAGIAALMDQPIVRHGMLRLPYEPPGRNRVLAEPPDPATRTIVAAAGGQIVGIASLKPNKNRRAHCADLALMAVHEGWQQRGIGSALMAAMLDIADNWLNLKRLYLNVLADNTPAIALYHRFGFVIEGQKRADVFRAGGFADSKVMARVTI